MEKSTLRILRTILGAVIILAIVIVLVLLIPSNKNKTATSNVSIPKGNLSTSSINQIKQNFVAFFAANTPTNERQSLLQNGSQIFQQSASDLTELQTEKPSASVSNVTLTNANTAKVTYTVDINGQPVLKNQPGEALKINNRWVVSDSTVCQLFSMVGQSPSYCANAK